MRKASRIDKNHTLIVKIFKAHGYSIQSLATTGKGVPDILVGKYGYNFLYEIKDGRNKYLTNDQIEWHNSWLGSVTVLRNEQDVYKEIFTIENTYNVKCSICGKRVNPGNGLQMTGENITPYCNKCLSKKISDIIY